MSEASDAAELEQFRLALSGDEAAWEYIYQRWRGQMMAWIMARPGFSLLDQEAQELVDEGFVRFYSARQGRPFGFPTLAAVLGYLKLCATSVVIDRQRELAARRRVMRTIRPQPGPDPAAELETRDAARQQATWLLRQAKNEAERLVLEGWLAEDTAGETFRRRPEAFGSIQRVYRLRENLKARLERMNESVV